MIKGLLKKLCISLLIGLPILFVNFSIAGLQEFDIGVAEDITANSSLGYSLRLTQNANFLTNDLYKVVQFKGSGQYPRRITYFWNGSGMYLHVSKPYDNNLVKVQGFLQYVNILTLSTIDRNYSVNPGFTPISTFLNDSQYSNPDKLLLGGYDDLQTSSLCFGYSDLDKAVCFSYNDATTCGGQPQYCSNGQNIYITNSLGLNIYNIADFASYATVSPFITNNIPPTYSIDDDIYTNRDIINGYEYLGLDVGYCYGGFDIDNIFLPNETIDDFTGYKFGYGATVFDLYNLYSGAYSTSKTFFAQMSQAYSNGQINRFKNEPKALIMFVQQFMSAKSRGRLNVGFYDLWDYCNLKFNANPDDEYTGHNDTGKRGADQNKTDNQNKGGFQFTGNNALVNVVGSGGTGFSNPAEFFGNITQTFVNGLGVVDTNYTGMIPTYILMFMFALILIRIIKH